MNYLTKYIWPAAAVTMIVIANVVSKANPIMAFTSLVGIMFVLGVANQRVTAQLYGAVLAALLGWFSYQAGFYGNMAINWFYVFPMSIIGFIIWLKRKDNTSSICRSVHKSKRLLLVLATLAIFVITYIVCAYTGASLPLHDAASTTLLLVATLLLTGGFKEQWYCWIPYNAIEVFMWFTAISTAPEMLAILAMRIVFLVNSLIGWYSWNK